MAETKAELQKAEKAMVKLRNKVKRADLDYTVQVSINSTEPTVVHYAAQMTAPANGLAPITFVCNTLDELVAKIKEAQDELNYDNIEKAYHQAQIEACHRTIQGHEDRIKELDNPQEDVAQPLAETAQENSEETATETAENQ